MISRSSIPKSDSQTRLNRTSASAPALDRRRPKFAGAVKNGDSCYAWNTLVDQPWKIMSIARRDWAAISQSL